MTVTHYSKGYGISETYYIYCCNYECSTVGQETNIVLYTYYVYSRMCLRGGDVFFSCITSMYTVFSLLEAPSVYFFNNPPTRAFIGDRATNRD